MAGVYIQWGEKIRSGKWEKAAFLLGSVYKSSHFSLIPIVWPQTSTKTKSTISTTISLPSRNKVTQLHLSAGSCVTLKKRNRNDADAYPPDRVELVSSHVFIPNRTIRRPVPCGCGGYGSVQTATRFLQPVWKKAILTPICPHSFYICFYYID